jgi:exodeoxyribonuclease VII large subunit
MTQQIVFSVSEITHTIKLLLEENIPTLWVVGEISNFKPHYSGHFYFSLKDENAQISAVLWKSRAESLAFPLKDGLLVQTFGNIRVYEKSGRYQFDVIKMIPAGIGQLQQIFEQLKQKLYAEGLFDEDHKKPLPEFPLRIGLVTSPTGAALQDMLNIFGRRAPHIEIILRPARVQGEGAAQDIARGIEDLNAATDVEVIIIGRGGGSLEDLWAFNEEVVARAIYNSKIPIISAVGHEIDFTIADFAADLRAPTPSAAAELASPDAAEIRESLRDYKNRISLNLLQRIKYNRERIQSFQKSYALRRPQDILKQYAFRIDELSMRLQRELLVQTAAKSAYVKQLNLRLNNLNPKKVLERGYSISYIDGKVIGHVSQVQPAMRMVTELADGKITSIVDKTDRKSDDHKKETEF